MELILLIEDDDDIREVLASLLRAKGYQVTAVTNGREALAVLEAGNIPCLIILDLMMPVMNGWDFRARQLADQRWASIPTVLLSGAADVHQEVVKLKAAGYIPKPIDFEILYQTVERHC